MLDFFYTCFPHLKNDAHFKTRLNANESHSSDEKDLIEKITLKKLLNHLNAPELIDDAVVSFDIPNIAKETLYNSIELLKPWRKGPFRINQIEIDGEWRSDIKWKHLGSETNIRGRRVLDIGANNGYYMFRTLLESPAWVLGIDPTFRYWAQYLFLRQLIQDKRLMYLPLGHQDLSFFPKQFDLVLCLGIIYHSTDPIALLKNIHRCLDRGGELILESQGILGDAPTVLIPKGKYAGAKGMWYLPTAKALEHWLIRTGFRQVKVFHSHKLLPSEQRTTKCYQGESLKTGMDPKDSSKTIEGYPAPIRIYMKARK